MACWYLTPNDRTVVAQLENYLVAMDGSVKLCDFGSATTTIIDPRDYSYDKARQGTTDGRGGA